MNTETNHSGPSSIRVDRDGDVAIITFDAPAKRNALTGDARRELYDVLHRLMNLDTEVRALVLTGAGGHFCAGADVDEMTAPAMLQVRQRVEEMARVASELTGGAKPVIAAVEGIAYGIGLSFMAACDLVVASREARMCAAFIRIGLLPDGGLLWTLPKRVGMPKARELMCLGAEVKDEEALAIGLANRVCEPGQALTEAIALAKSFSAMPMLGLTYLKNTLAFRSDSFDDSLRAELDHQVVLRHSADHVEAARAFIEKRAPVFKGQ